MTTRFARYVYSAQAIAEAVIEGRTIYEQSLVKEKVDDRPTGEAESAAEGAAGGV